MKTIESENDTLDLDYSDYSEFYEGITGYQIMHSSVKPEQMSTHKHKGYITRRKVEELKEKIKLKHHGFDEEWH